MRDEARCVIIGGGAMGVGLLYHLAHEGWTDTVLVEKGELTSGSTWHAAGLVPNFIGDLNMAKVHNDAVRLYPKLEEETGLSAGWHGCGAVRLALNDQPGGKPCPGGANVGGEALHGLPQACPRPRPRGRGGDLGLQQRKRGLG